MKKLAWESIIDCYDDENGIDTCWAAEINHKRYGKFVWISLQHTGKYSVNVSMDGNMISLVECKSLTSAKRWAARFL